MNTYIQLVVHDHQDLCLLDHPRGMKIDLKSSCEIQDMISKDHETVTDLFMLQKIICRLSHCSSALTLEYYAF